MSSLPTIARLSELKNRLDRLRSEAESAVSNIKRVLTRGYSVLMYQESMQNLEHFLLSYPGAVTEMDVLVNSLVKLNCELEISLGRKSDFLDMLQGFEINDSLCDGEFSCNCANLCETSSKEKKTIVTSTDFSDSGQVTVGTNTDSRILNWDTIGTNTDLSAFTQETVGINTDFSTLSWETVGTNTDFSILPEETIGSNTGTLSREAVDTNTDLSALVNETVGTSTDFGELAQEATNKIEEFTVDIICKVYDIQNESILEMLYLQGGDPTQFWLKYYSDSELTSHLIEIKRKLNSGELKKVTTALPVGQFFIGCIDTVFRGCVLSFCNGKIMALDIDRGILKYVTNSDIWDIGDHISKFPPQALLCKLYNIPDELPWFTYLSELFRNCLSKSNLVVIVKDIIPGAIPTFVIDVDVHDRSLLNVNMSEWINSYVIPAVKKTRSFDLCDGDEKTMFQNIDPYTLYIENDDSDTSLQSEQNAENVQEDTNIDKDVLEIKETVLFNIKTIDEREVISTCTDVGETLLNGESESISQSFFDNSEKNSMENSSTNFVVENLKDNSMNEKMSSISIEGQVCQKQSKRLIFAQLSEPHESIFKSTVQCCLEKDRILEMSFLQGDNPWCFVLSCVPKQEIIDVKRKIAERAQQGLLIPFSNMPKIGDFAVGKCDHEYLRVRITNIPAQGCKYFVCIDIDSRDQQLFKLNDLWVLNSEFSLPSAMAIQCSLWNIPRNPFYWDNYLTKLFKAVLTRSTLLVHVKDVEYLSCDWNHIVQIQVSENNIFDVSEWIMLYIFPNIEKIRQFSACQGFSEMVSNLDPYKLFKDNLNASGSLQNSMHVILPTLKESESKVYKPSTDESVHLKLHNPIFDFVLALSNPKTSQRDTFFGHIFENYKIREICTKSSSKLHHNPSLFGFKKHLWGVKPCTKYYVNLSCIFSPSEFYVQIISDECSSIDDMHKELENYCSFGSIHFRNKEEAKQLILLCCAVNYKNQWCRGRIIDWLDDSSDDAIVFLVDYGIYASVSFYSIQSLRSDFYKYPVYAQKCSLSGISPPNTDGFWPENSLEGFWSILNYKSIYEICIEKYLETEETMFVILSNSENKDIECINDYLIDKGFAVCQNDYMNIPERCHSRVCPTYDPEVNEIVSDDDFFDDNITKEHEEMESYLSDNIIGLPGVGEHLPVIITEIVNIGAFYAVYTNCQHQGRSRNTREVLTELNTKIMFAVEDRHVKTSKQLIVGNIVIARYSKDEKWYRARLLSTVDESGYVEVFFVDYGNVDNIHKSFVKEMKKEFCEVPFQAMRFSIDDIDIRELNDPRGQENALVLLDDLVEKSETYIKVIRITSEDIFVKVFCERSDIALEMLDLYHITVQ